MPRSFFRSWSESRRSTRCGKLKLLAWVILLSQAYPAYELNMTYLGGYNQLKEEGFAGMDNNSLRDLAGHLFRPGFFPVLAFGEVVAKSPRRGFRCASWSTPFSSAFLGAECSG